MKAMKKEQSTKHPGGRPTDYRPEYCERVIEYGKQGKSYTQIACELDITRETLYQWRDTYPQFSDALTRARQAAQKWWEDKGQEGLFIPGFNASLWNKQVSCRFRDDYTDTARTELTGRDGKPIEMETRNKTDEQLQNEIQALLAKTGIK